MKTIIIFIIATLLMVNSIIGIRVSIYSGSSMCPTLPESGIMVTKRVNNLDEVELGKIYGYRMFIKENQDFEEGSAMTNMHRLVSKEGNALIFERDSDGGEEWIDINRLSDKHLFTIPLRMC